LLVFLALAILAVVWVFSLYNGLVRLRNAVRNAWSQIDVQLKRRHDLVPNLVETVKGYAAHEKETLERVIAARNFAVTAAGPAEAGKAEGVLSGALKSLFALSESYPDLKANQNFLALQEELASTENKIAFSRQAYNDAVMRYNNKTEVIPSNIIAGMFGFKASEFFEIESPGERNVPKVQF
ncbi:MAG TPA: LemA family protein, partial [Acidobacteriota bacterium]|nr:LemA family protein [Acidobacteriota bacterium]